MSPEFRTCSDSPADRETWYHRVLNLALSLFRFVQSNSTFEFQHWVISGWFVFEWYSANHVLGFGQFSSISMSSSWQWCLVKPVHLTISLIFQESSQRSDFHQSTSEFSRFLEGIEQRKQVKNLNSSLPLLRFHCEFLPVIFEMNWTSNALLYKNSEAWE